MMSIIFTAIGALILINAIIFIYCIKRQQRALVDTESDIVDIAIPDGIINAIPDVPDGQINAIPDVPDGQINLAIPSDNSCMDITNDSTADESTILLNMYHNLNSKNYYCIICSQLMNEITPICKLVPCMHTYHKVCVLQWFTHQYKTSATYNCPMCRYDMPNDAITITLNHLVVQNRHIEYMI